MMNLREAAAKLDELFPGTYSTAEAKITNTGNPRHTVPDEVCLFVASKPSAFMVKGQNVDALIHLATLEVNRRVAVEAAKSAPPQDVSAAAECLTQALTQIAGPEYTAEEHERAGAMLVRDVEAQG